MVWAVVVAEGGWGDVSEKYTAATYDARTCIMVSLLWSGVPPAPMLSEMPQENQPPSRKKKKNTRRESVQPAHTRSRSR